VALLQGRDVSISVAATGGEAMELLSRENFDCMVLDLGLSDMSGFDLLEHIGKQEEKRRLPVIIHSGKTLDHEEELQLRHYTESIIIKGAKSPERLLNEVTLFLHQVESSLNPDKQRLLQSSFDKETMLEGKKVLLVDDDMRNIFSLSSVLTDKNMVIVEAENGREALARLEEHPDVDLVLMDIMMPEMDGYETIRAIRSDSRFKRLSIIAMTAKALKGDQEKCLEAGASDYIAKPIDVDKLLSLMRVWLYQKG
jgi:CheY-like chemotaxis protein